MKLTIGGLALVLTASFAGLSTGCASGDKEKGAEEAVDGEGEAPEDAAAAATDDGKKKKDKKGAKKEKKGAKKKKKGA